MNIVNVPFQEISEWVNRSDDPFFHQASFAHLKVSRHFLSDESVWSIIVAGLWDADFGFCIGSSLDAGTAFYKFNKFARPQDDSPSFEFSCYHGWVKSLEGYRVADGAGLESWNLPMVTADLIVVAFVIDPQMSAECALALIATVQWAADIGSNYIVRILTISFEDAPRALRKLLYHYNLSQPYIMSLNPPDGPASVRREVHSIVRPDQNDLAKAFRRESQGDLERQAVVSWQKLPQFDHDQDRQVIHVPRMDIFVQDRVDLVHNLTKMRQGECESRFSVPIDQCRTHSTAWVDGCYIRCVPPAFRSPFPLDGFDNLHLFLSSHREQLIYDAVTGQLTRVNLPICHEERLEQVAWAVRTRNIPSRISIYTEASSVEEFVSSGSRHRRLKVCNEQVGGFITATIRQFAHWGVDTSSVLCCFFEMGIDKMAHLSLLDRLHMQSILGDEGPPIGLIDHHLDVFDQVLPLVGFDHRLALFVALPSNSAVVRQVKVQLAALLTAGFDQLFTFDTDVSDEDLTQWCSGWTKPLASTGSMWLALGLWKGGALEYDEYASPKVALNATDGKLKFDDCGVSVDIPTCLDVNRTITSICSAFMAHEIPMLPVRTEDEFRDLDFDEAIELQKHLLHAYIFQLTRQVDGLDGSGHYDVTTRMCIDVNRGIPHWTKPNINLERFQGADSESSPSTFGIYHSMKRAESSGTICLSDWTWISTSVVAD